MGFIRFCDNTDFAVRADFTLLQPGGDISNIF